MVADMMMYTTMWLQMYSNNVKRTKEEKSLERLYY